MESTGLLIDQLYDRINKLEVENARLRAELAAIKSQVNQAFMSRCIDADPAGLGAVPDDGENL